MIVTNYKDLNATDLFAKIVKREEDFLSADYNSLSFIEKCKYMTQYASHHRVSSKLYRFTEENINEMRCELIKRSLLDDIEGCYYLAKLGRIIGVSEEDRIKALKRAADAGHVPAAILYLRSFPFEENYLMAQDVADRIPKLDNLLLRYEAMRACYPVLRKCDSNENYPPFDETNYEYHLALAKEGNVDALVHLESITSRAMKRAKDSKSVADLVEENAFWSTLLYMVYEHFYKTAEPYMEESLGYKLIRGSGCDRDEDAGVFHTINAIRRAFEQVPEHDNKRELLVECMMASKNPNKLDIIPVVKAVVYGDDEELSRILEAAKHEDNRGDLVIDAAMMYHTGHYRMNKEDEE